MSLVIRKKGVKNFFHYFTIDGTEFVYSASDLVIIFENTKAKLRSLSGRPIALKDGYLVSEITIYDDTDTGSAETFANFIDLQARLVVLGYPPYFSPQTGNSINRFYIAESAFGVVRSIPSTFYRKSNFATTFGLTLDTTQSDFSNVTIVKPDFVAKAPFKMGLESVYVNINASSYDFVVVKTVDTSSKVVVYESTPVGQTIENNSILTPITISKGDFISIFIKRNDEGAATAYGQMFLNFVEID